MAQRGNSELKQVRPRRERDRTTTSRRRVHHLAMPLEDAMRTQRAIRRIKADPVDDDLLLHLLRK